MASVTRDDLEAAYKARGVATEKERAVEDEIFTVEADHSDSEIATLIARYKAAKSVRADASLEAARLYMLASPAVRRSADWKSYTPGHDNDPGRGVIPDDSIV